MEVIHFTNNTFVPQCLVCNSSSMNTYVDLSLFTSKTSHSETPIKEKIKYILNNKWIPAFSETSFSLCLPCFHLIDQFDSLEIQLKIIQDDICSKYISSHVITQPVQTIEKSTNQESSRLVTSERVKRTSKRTLSKKKKYTSENIPTLHAQIVQLDPADTRHEHPSESPPTLLQWHTTPVALYDTAAAAVSGGAPLLVANIAASPGSALPVAWPTTDNVQSGDACGIADPGGGLRIYTLESQTQPQVQLPVPPLAPLSRADEDTEVDVDDPGLPAAATPLSVLPLDTTCTLSASAVIPGTSLATLVAAARGEPPPLVLLPRPGEQTLHSQAVLEVVSDQILVTDNATPPPPPVTPTPPAWVPRPICDETVAHLCEGERVRVGVSTEDDGAACSFCPLGFVDGEALLRHARTVHRPTVLTARLPPHLGLGETTNCGFQMENAEPVTPKDAYARPFACLFCDSVFKFKSNIQLHFKEKHTPHKPFVCPDCSEAFRRSLDMSRHRVYYCVHRKKKKTGLKLDSNDGTE